MISVLVILLIALAAAAFTVSILRKALPGEGQKKALPPPAGRGLFSGQAFEDKAGGIDEKPVRASGRKTELIARARLGDTGVLSDAHATGDAGLYKEVLDALIEQACERPEQSRQEAILDLVNQIAKGDELRANTKLAEIIISNWKDAPDRRSTIEMLHIAALSDDAATYQKAVEEVLRVRQKGKLTGIAAEELLALVESEYWVLASEARLGGAGFRLKRMLADVRRKLATATPAR
jgi:hypothetical protein